MSFLRKASHGRSRSAEGRKYRHAEHRAASGSTASQSSIDKSEGLNQAEHHSHHNRSSYRRHRSPESLGRDGPSKRAELAERPDGVLASADPSTGAAEATEPARKSGANVGPMPAGLSSSTDAHGRLSNLAHDGAADGNYKMCYSELKCLLISFDLSQ